MKTCNKCGIKKDESEFGIRNRMKHGISNTCRTCLAKSDRKRNKERYQRNKDKLKAIALEGRNKHKYKIKKCSACGEKKESKLFVSSSTNPYGYTNLCKECSRIKRYALKGQSLPDKYKCYDCGATDKKLFDGNRPSITSDCRCITCKVSYEKDRRSKYGKKYRNENREIINKKVRIRKKTKKGRALDRERCRRRNKKIYNNLCDSYIKSLICSRSDLKHGDIPQELIDLKRIEVQIKREVDS